MKAIELTEEQKKKLLEMCKVLFPEFTFGFENDISDLGILEYYTDSPKWKFIHWFEFCINILPNKIEEKYKGNTGTCTWGIYDGLIHDKHPVDYLYKKFKKFKELQNDKETKQ